MGSEEKNIALENRKWFGQRGRGGGDRARDRGIPRGKGK